MKTKMMRLKTGDQLRITYHPAGQTPMRIWTTVVATVDGHDLVVVDKQGRLYTTWWTEQAHWYLDFRPTDRRWRRYNLGIFYLGRALLYALTEADQVKIPAIGELQNFCRQHNAKVAALEGNILPQLQAMSRQFSQLQQFLQYRKRRGFRQSQEQLSFFLLFRDSRGRINIGVLRARLAAIDGSFMKELEHLCGWTPHYAARLQAVRNLQRQFQQNVQDANSRLSAMMAHEAMKTGKTSAKQVAGLKSVISSVIEVITKLAAVQPFCRWAKYCLADLRSALAEIDANRFANAYVVLKRLLESMKLRLIGFELEKLIEQISLDLFLGRTDRDAYWHKVIKLRDQLERINETGFVEPVCQHALALVQAGKEALDHFEMAGAKDCFKKAAALI